MASLSNMSTLIFLLLSYKCGISSCNKYDAQLSRAEKELLNLQEYILNLRKDLHQERIERRENIEALNRTISHCTRDCQGNDQPRGGRRDFNESTGFGFDILGYFDLNKIKSLQRGFEREKTLRIMAEKHVNTLEKRLQLFEDDLKAQKTMVIVFENNIGQVQANVGSLKTDMNNMASDIGSINTNVRSTKDDLRAQKTMVISFENNIGQVQANVNSLKIDMNNIRTDMRRTNEDTEEKLSHFDTTVKTVEKAVENIKTKVIARSQRVVVLGRLKSTLTTFRTGQKIVFDDIYVNLGNSYQTSTGIFTAPVAGLYIVVLAISSDHNPTPVVDIVRNGVTLCRTVMAVLSSWSIAPCTVVVHLNQFDQIWTQVSHLHYKSHTIRADLFSSFSVGLISPD